jgi:hypothetical protein
LRHIAQLLRSNQVVNVFEHCIQFNGKHRMAIHLEDLPVASPVIAQEAAGRLEKVVHPKNAGAGLHHF